MTSFKMPWNSVNPLTPRWVKTQKTWSPGLSNPSCHLPHITSEIEQAKLQWTLYWVFLLAILPKACRCYCMWMGMRRLAAISRFEILSWSSALPGQTYKRKETWNRRRFGLQQQRQNDNIHGQPKLEKETQRTLSRLIQHVSEQMLVIPSSSKRANN